MIQAKTGGFRMLPSYYEAIRGLPDDERLRLWDAVMDFGFGGEVGELTPISSAIFTLIVPTLEKSVRYFETKRENGSKAKRSESKAKRSETEAKEKRDSDSDSEGDSDSESEHITPAPGARKETTRFVPPSAEEIADYCAERGNRVDPAKFADYYAARGWKVGSGPMKDWKAAVRTWERRENAHGDAGYCPAGVAAGRPVRDFGVRYDNEPAADADRRV